MIPSPLKSAGANTLSHLFLLAACLLGCAAQSDVGSIGAVLGLDAESKEIYVRELAKDAPSSDAGLQVGDEILMVDGLFVRNLGKEELRRAMRGRVGSSVRLTVVRGKEVVHLDVKRTAIKALALKPGEERLAEQ